MDNFTFLIIKECQIARFCLFNKAERSAAVNLLAGITGDDISGHLINYLCQT